MFGEGLRGKWLIDEQPKMKVKLFYEKKTAYVCATVGGKSYTSKESVS